MALRRALELDAELGDAYWQRGVLLQKQGASRDALADLKIALEKLSTIDGITARVGGTAGLPYETITGLTGVVQLSQLDKDHGVILVRGTDGKHNLQTIDLP